jgi:hypothetical protein
MKIIFLLETKIGHVGDFHYDWQCSFVPRIGEGVHVENIFDEGRFVNSDDDGIKSKVGDVEDYVLGMYWKVTGITWCKKEEYFMNVSLFGE